MILIPTAVSINKYDQAHSWAAARRGLQVEVFTGRVIPGGPETRTGSGPRFLIFFMVSRVWVGSHSITVGPGSVYHYV